LQGRICDDGQKFMDSIELFQEFCREQGCWDRPFQFASDYSRYFYFQKTGADPHYAAFDTTKFEVILTCAVPGTGKDYWIQQNYPDLPVVSLDDLRVAMDIAPTDNQGAVVKAAYELARSYLQRQQSFVWNATNVMSLQRRSLIEFFANYGARVRIVYLEVPIERALQQNRDRSRVVPGAVVDRFRRRMEIPNLTEAHCLEFIVNF
jgi:predicted kinase